MNFVTVSNLSERASVAVDLRCVLTLQNGRAPEKQSQVKIDTRAIRNPRNLKVSMLAADWLICIGGHQRSF